MKRADINFIFEWTITLNHIKTIYAFMYLFSLWVMFPLNLDLVFSFKSLMLTNNAFIKTFKIFDERKVQKNKHLFEIESL